jgi:hypothetical protein
LRYQCFNQNLANRDNSRDNTSPLPEIGDHFGDHFISLFSASSVGGRTSTGAYLCLELKERIEYLLIDMVLLAPSPIPHPPEGQWL